MVVLLVYNLGNDGNARKLIMQVMMVMQVSWVMMVMQVSWKMVVM